MSAAKRAALLALSLALALALGFAVSGVFGPDMPMEVVVDGDTITLGKTTMADLAALGYEADSAGRQEVAHEGDPYIYFTYRLSRGAGRQFWVSVYTPYYGRANINREAEEAAQWGIVYSVVLSKSALKRLSAVYNGLDLPDITYDTARAWGAREDGGASGTVWRLTASRGTLAFTAERAAPEELDTLQITLNSKAFADMQKK